MDRRALDPILNELDEARRQIMAEHGNDWRKVLQWYVDLDKQHARENGSNLEKQDRSSGAPHL